MTSENRRNLISILLLALLCLVFVALGCGGDDDDDDAASAVDDDDDSSDDDSADDDDDTVDDDDDHVDCEDNEETVLLPTTLDQTLVPVEQDGVKVLVEGQGEAHVSRNDLSVVPSDASKEGQRLSLGYFTTITDLHQTDEESPTRLSFLHAWTVMFGSFESFFRAQEDLTPQMLNAMARTMNHLQRGYGRDFDLCLVLGDGADNGQKNEFETLIDNLDGTGLTSGSDCMVRPDSGDLDIDSQTGMNLGERDFGAQETDGQGNNTNPYNRPAYPNSNADFRTKGLVRADGSPLPWFYTIGNHDALANGGFDPDGDMSCNSRAAYVGDHSIMGYLPGIGAAVDYMDQNPGQPLRIGCGFLGMDIDWQGLMWLFRLGGDWTTDIDPRFDLEEFTHGTPEDPTDDGVTITADSNREFLGHDLIPLMHKAGHGFFDHNSDDTVDAADGGWYRIDMADISDAAMPLRFLVLDTTQAGISSLGGIRQDQLDWLQAELDQAVQDKVLVIVCSHHFQGAILKGLPQLRMMLSNCPNVILHLVGHGHENVVTPHPAQDDDPLKGYWEVETPSARDFPQQGRIFEIVDNRDGTGSIYSTLFNFSQTKFDDPDALAKLGRDLSVSEWAWGFSMGGAEDRNVELLFAIPEDVALELSQIESDGAVTSVDALGQLW